MVLTFLDTTSTLAAMSTTAVLPTDDRAARGDDPHVRVAIIGAGFTGLAMVHALRKAGMHDWLMVERAQDVGGVWRSNTYPGIACDVPSHLYSFSFAPNPDWERTFSGGRQIWEYTQRVARDLDMGEQARFGEELLDATWDAERAVWRLRTTTLRAHRRRRRRRHRRADRSDLPGDRGPRPLPGRPVPLRRLGSRPGPHGQARRRHRHRRVGDPDRAGDPEAGRQAHGLPAHARAG